MKARGVLDLTTAPGFGHRIAITRRVLQQESADSLRGFFAEQR